MTDKELYALLLCAATDLEWLLPETVEGVATLERRLMEVPMSSYDRATTFHSAQTFELEEGGTAHVTMYAYKDSGAIRHHISITPPGSLLTDRDAGILSGLLMGAAFSPPAKPLPSCHIPGAPHDAIY